MVGGIRRERAVCRHMVSGVLHIFRYLLTRKRKRLYCQVPMYVGKRACARPRTRSRASFPPDEEGSRPRREGGRDSRPAQSRPPEVPMCLCLMRRRLLDPKASVQPPSSSETGQRRAKSLVCRTSAFSFPLAHEEASQEFSLCTSQLDSCSHPYLFLEEKKNGIVMTRLVLWSELFCPQPLVGSVSPPPFMPPCEAANQIHRTGPGWFWKNRAPKAPESHTAQGGRERSSFSLEDHPSDIIKSFSCRTVVARNE